MAVQTSNIIGNQIYRTDDAPLYYTGNKVLIAIVCYNLVLFVGTKIFYVKVNKYVVLFLFVTQTEQLANDRFLNRKRATKWNAMSKEEKEYYLQTTTDKGNKRLDFRFSH